MTAHTPGPWNLINDVCVGGPVSPGWEAAGSGIAHCGMRARTPDEAAANARLISAAPDLYDALARIVASVSSGPSGSVCQTSDFEDAKAALAKARGETVK